MIFFNSSMPRSGSTLIQNILGQNPDIHVTPTDGFLELIYAARVNFTNNAEFKAQDQQQMIKAWRGFCNKGMQGYTEGLSNKPNTCIKSRGIGANFEWFSKFMGENPKIICTVRDVKAILSSMEKMFRKNSENAQTIENASEMSGLTTESRVQQWLQSPPVGLALQRFGQMALQNISSKCLFVKFEDLTLAPNSQMKRIYEYIELPFYEHNFDNVEQLTKEDDVIYGMTQNLHTVRPRIKPVNDDYNEILGENLCKWIDQTCAGYQSDFGYL